jgi:sulfatase maturation enzyme AslB (radical SAM superfamily)
MEKRKVVQALGRIVTGRSPSLSIEITRDCPLSCPGCYAYEPTHLGAAGPLASLAQLNGDQLVAGILSLVNQHNPLHLSIVGGEPMLRWREIDRLIPTLLERGIEVQIVTSGIVPFPANWIEHEGLQLVVSIDGLREDHDVRRKPATYERILRNIAGQRIKVHCTITRQMLGKPGYFEEFLEYWSARPETAKIWFSLFTPQRNAHDDEIISPKQRSALLDELDSLRKIFPKLYLPDLVLEGFRNPPTSPAQCIFARTTLSVSSDLRTKITPCQFGGDPDCSNCGCMASVGLKAVGDYKVFGLLTAGSIFKLTDAIGKRAGSFSGRGRTA